MNIEEKKMIPDAAEPEEENKAVPDTNEAKNGNESEMFDEDRAETAEQKRERARNAFKFPEESMRGVLKLFVPVMCKDKEYYELHYDFSKLSGKEVVENLDVDPNADNNSGLSNRQAIFMFSVACSKAERGISGLDAVDVRTQLSPRDMIGAIRLGKSFFVHSLVGAQLSIFKM